MSKVDTTMTATTDGTYGMVNNFIGQIKAQLVNDTQVSVISDNDPANTTARVLIYSIDSQAHYIKLTASASTKLKISILALDQATDLKYYEYTVASGGNYTFQFLYNTKAHVWYFGTYYCSVVAIDAGDSLGWYMIVNIASSGNAWYVGDRDGTITAVFPSYGALQNGSLAGVPVGFIINSDLSAYRHLYCWANANLFSTGWYTYDSADYLVMGTTWGICIKDAVPA